jgi:hypothetical protein
MKRLIARIFIVALAVMAGMFLFAIPSRAQIPAEEFTSKNPHVQGFMAIQEEFTPVLMAGGDVLGTAVGRDEDGEPSILVYVDLETKNIGQVIRSLPTELRGRRVRIELTDKFRAMPGKPSKPGSGGVSHTAKQPTPIQLGTSGGWRYDLANGYCCGGTLGSLVQIGGTQYILSNYHVLEADIVSGGNKRVAANGDPVVQCGLIDAACNASATQNVGTLVVKHSLPNSNVDAAVAAVAPGMVRADGAILEIGTISASTVTASVNQAVKKSGRTTGLTRSKISALNATISVTYENECAGGTAFTKNFTGQIIIANRSSQFLNSGDSGSLMVEDATTNPRAVGLLFAGSSSFAVANPIGQVLSFLGATMVGN